MAPSTRDRILAVTAELYRRQGLHDTGLKQITHTAKAPAGSVYHHFPGGKRELTAEVVRMAGREYGEAVMAILDAQPNVPDGIVASFATAAHVLETTDFLDACPIETIALEVASTDETLRVATAEVFDSWIGLLTRWFERTGLAEPTCRTLAVTYLAGLEGAFVLARSLRSTEPLTAAGASLKAATLAAWRDAEAESQT